LPGAYRRSALPLLERRLRAGKLAVGAAVEELDARVVDLDPAVLTNVNHPHELPRPALAPRPGLFSRSREILFGDG
jgi:molybdopterin-guanine dinucleotide biosynthesis protein A